MREHSGGRCSRALRPAPSVTVRANLSRDRDLRPRHCGAASADGHSEGCAERPEPSGRDPGCRGARAAGAPRAAASRRTHCRSPPSEVADEPPPSSPPPPGAITVPPPSSEGVGPPPVVASGDEEEPESLGPPLPLPPSVDWLPASGGGALPHDVRGVPGGPVCGLRPRLLMSQLALWACDQIS